MAADGTQASLLVAASSLGLDIGLPPSALARSFSHSAGRHRAAPVDATDGDGRRPGGADARAHADARPGERVQLGRDDVDRPGRTPGGTATLLNDGRVLMTTSCGKAAALFDPATGTSTATGSLTVPRGGDTATLLRDGRVLLAGGYNCAPAGLDGIWRSAEIYDPATGTFAATGPMHKPREQHTATLLADGRVLIAGGYTANEPPAAGAIVLASVRTVESTSSILASAEIYDPATGTFSRTGPMTTFRNDHTATLLQDGRVLVAGGGGEAYPSSTSADLYDPATGTFSKTGSMKTGRWLHTATLLQDGRVLITGGRSPKDSVYRSAELYDPGPARSARQARWTTAASSTRRPCCPTAGSSSRAATGATGSKVECCPRPRSSTRPPATFTATGSMGTPRDGHAAMLLPDGRVLIVGGGDTSAVVYQP